MKEQAAQFFKEIQSELCQSVEKLDGGASFSLDNWTREDLKGTHGGGGLTRVLKKGRVFESAGVNFSEVSGSLPEEMSEKLTGEKQFAPFYATGVSLVFHPENPMVPTVHANFRYLEVAGFKWFGGGADLTPYYLFEEDAKHFHSIFKVACDKHSTEYYPKFKEACDKYFYLPHREECRGIGGIFFDYLGKEDIQHLESNFLFVKDVAKSFSEAYLPIAEKRKSLPYTEVEKDFQLHRRGRYVEFNLLHDRGTLFGLKTNGRIESILMSLPPNVSWSYDYDKSLGEKEQQLINTLKSPKQWI